MLAEAAMHSDLRTEKLQPEDVEPTDGNYYAAMFKIMSNLYDIGSEVRFVLSVTSAQQKGLTPS